MSFVYWIYDHTCGSEINFGYVGVSEKPTRRLFSLRSVGTVPRDAKQIILFEGTRPECLAREKKLRPRPNIGWNRNTRGDASAPLRRYTHSQWLEHIAHEAAHNRLAEQLGRSALEQPKKLAAEQLSIAAEIGAHPRSRLAKQLSIAAKIGAASELEAAHV